MRASACFAILLIAACRHSAANTISVDEFSEPPSAEGEYVIRPGDLINVRVFQQESMSGRGRVRGDGKISLPFLNDVVAAGLTPVVLSRQLEVRLKEFINNPVVTISLEEGRAASVSVLGEVLRPGVFTLDSSAGVLQALAAAGGFSPFTRRAIFVLRYTKEGQPPARIHFDYDDLASAVGKGAAFRLRAGDVIIVE